MAKDLPYFKFFCSEWNDGDVTLESYEAQGLFINVCSYYWSNECDITIDKLLKKFRGFDTLLDELSEASLFKVDDDGSIRISFLDEQREDRTKQSREKRKAGLASAEARRLKKLEQEANINSTESQQVLNSCSTESQLLRREEKREEEKRKDNTLSSLQEPKTDIFNQWLNFRKEVKKEIKVLLTLEKLVKKFNDEPLAKCEWVVNNSIENGYQGLFWDNYKGQSGKVVNPRGKVAINFNN